MQLAHCTQFLHLPDPVILQHPVIANDIKQYPSAGFMVIETKRIQKNIKVFNCDEINNSQQGWT